MSARGRPRPGPSVRADGIDGGGDDPNPAQARRRGFMRNLNDRVGWAIGMGSIFSS